MQSFAQSAQREELDGLLSPESLFFICFHNLLKIRICLLYTCEVCFESSEKFGAFFSVQCQSVQVCL